MCVYFVLLNDLLKAPGIKKTICRLHWSCSIRFLKTGHRAFPVKFKVSNPHCNAFHFLLCFQIKPWMVWKHGGDWCIFTIVEMTFFSLHVEAYLWKHFKWRNSESCINILILVQHGLVADWSEAKIHSYMYCEMIWGNQIFLPHISKSSCTRAKCRFNLTVCTNIQTLQVTV